LVPNKVTGIEMTEQNKPPRARAQMRAQIDENLKRVYEASLSEDLPDRFKDLLSQLRAVDQQQSVDK
jgi:hypothetical protein